jgi:hypothetical protein
MQEAALIYQLIFVAAIVGIVWTVYDEWFKKKR